VIKSFYLWPFQFIFMFCSQSFKLSLNLMIKPVSGLFISLSPISFDVEFRPSGRVGFKLEDLVEVQDD